MREVGIGEVIGRGAVADIHAFGDNALKLYHAGRPKAAAFIEAAILAIVETHGLPAPRIHEAGSYLGRWGLVMDRVAGPTLAEESLADPTRLAACLDETVRLQLLVHAITETRLRPLRARLAANIGRTGLLPDGVKRRLKDRLAGLPDGDRLCHGDFHPYNILGVPGQTTIIDWLDATAGSPAADACRTYLLLGMGMPGAADGYLARYASQSGLAAADILCWLPCVAGARLNEGVAGETDRLAALAEAV